MSGRVDRTPAALHDLDEAADYIRRNGGPDRAIRFLKAADATLARLCTLPGLGTPYEPGEPAFAGLRVLSVDGHRNHLVFYRPMAGGIQVLRLLHGARDIDGILSTDLDVDEGNDAEP